MESRIDQFRNFVRKYPGIKDVVKNGNKTWQALYEDWVMLGEDDSAWDIYKSVPNSSDLGSKKLDELLTTSNIKNIIEYVKKINPDNISKTLNTVQKVLQITQSFGRAAGKRSFFLGNFDRRCDFKYCQIPFKKVVRRQFYLV